MRISTCWLGLYVLFVLYGEQCEARDQLPDDVAVEDYATNAALTKEERMIVALLERIEDKFRTLGEYEKVEFVKMIANYQDRFATTLSKVETIPGMYGLNVPLLRSNLGIPSTTPSTTSAEEEIEEFETIPGMYGLNVPLPRSNLGIPYTTPYTTPSTTPSTTPATTPSTTPKTSYTISIPYTAEEEIEELEYYPRVTPSFTQEIHEVPEETHETKTEITLDDLYTLKLYGLNVPLQRSNLGIRSTSSTTSTAEEEIEELDFHEGYTIVEDEVEISVEDMNPVYVKTNVQPEFSTTPKTSETKTEITMDDMYTLTLQLYGLNVPLSTSKLGIPSITPFTTPSTTPKTSIPSAEEEIEELEIYEVPEKFEETHETKTEITMDLYTLTLQLNLIMIQMMSNKPQQPAPYHPAVHLPSPPVPSYLPVYNRYRYNVPRQMTYEEWSNEYTRHEQVIGSNPQATNANVVDPTKINQ